MSFTPELEFTASRGDLVTAMRAAKRVIGPRPLVPVLGGVLIEAHPNGDATLSAHNMETAITVTLPGAAARPGRVVVDHAETLRLLTALVPGKTKAADAVPVTVVASEGTVTMGANDYTVPVTSHDIEDYPALPAPVEPTVSVERMGFLRGLRQVLPALSHDETLPMLMSVQLRMAQGGVRMEATDRYRFASVHLPLRKGGDRKAELTAGLVPGQLMGDLARYLTGDEVAIGSNEETFSVHSRGFTITMHATGGVLPDIAPYMPEPNATVTADRRALVDAIEAARGITAAKREQEVVALQISTDSIEVAPVLSDGKASAPHLPASTTDLEEQREIGVNARFALDGIGAIVGETITFHLSESRKMLITESGVRPDDEAASFYLLMAIRLAHQLEPTQV